MIATDEQENVNNEQLLLDNEKEIEGMKRFMAKGTSEFKKKLTNAIIKMIIVDHLPFSKVEKTGFKNLIKLLKPSFTIPHSSASVVFFLPTLNLKSNFHFTLLFNNSTLIEF